SSSIRTAGSSSTWWCTGHPARSSANQRCGSSLTAGSYGSYSIIAPSFRCSVDLADAGRSLEVYGIMSYSYSPKWARPDPGGGRVTTMKAAGTRPEPRLIGQKVLRPRAQVEDKV